MEHNPLNTRQRLLNAACITFAEKGFRDATVAEICETADANIAAVNYHFGDKEKLYDEVWRYAFSITAEVYPLDGGLPENPTTEDSLYSYASAILHRIFSEDETGLFAKLLYREMAAPTLALDRIAKEALAPQNKYMRTVVEKALGEGMATDQFHHCMHSIIGQCAFFNFSRPLRERVMGKKSIPEEEIEAIARHIAKFSLGGLKEIQK
jgi:AcrR family transcriptional regulator